MSIDKLNRRIRVLKDVSIFKHTAEEVLLHIAESLTYELHPKGLTLFHKGEMGDSMFIIEKGSVKVHDADHVFSILKEDEFFGEYYLIDSEERSASITTLEETELLKISQDTFYKLMAKNIGIIRGILKTDISRLRHMNEIEEELAAKNEKISKQKLELEALNATKDKFFSILAHDLRSPLGTIISFFEFLNSQIDDLNKHEIVDLVKSIYHSTDRLLKLLDNLLQWSRIQTGQLTCQPELFDIKQSIDTCIELLEMNASKKDVNLYSEIKDNIWAYGDINMFNTVARNLISNSIKFSHPGDSVWVSVKQGDSSIEVNVHDTGVGISKKSIDKLFRLDVKHSTIGTRDEKGTGLGLNLCKEFVELNGGEIKVESEPGKGTIVRFTLPKSSKSPKN